MSQRNKQYRLFHQRTELGMVAAEYVDFPAVGGTFTPNLELRRTKRVKHLWKLIACSIRDSIFDIDLFGDYNGEFDELIDSNDWHLLSEDGEKLPISIPGFFASSISVQWR